MSAHRFQRVAALLAAAIVLSACAVQLPATPPAAGDETAATPAAAVEATTEDSAGEATVAADVA
ncbi:MAG: hypothetical protein KDD91_20460, partial [Caldilinea sp.]|nr:hypothetical protein [Caldilinea sp.]